MTIRIADSETFCTFAARISYLIRAFNELKINIE